MPSASICASFIMAEACSLTFFRVDEAFLFSRTFAMKKPATRVAIAIIMDVGVI